MSNITGFPAEGLLAQPVCTCVSCAHRKILQRGDQCEVMTVKRGYCPVSGELAQSTMSCVDARRKLGWLECRKFTPREQA